MTTLKAKTLKTLAKMEEATQLVHTFTADSKAILAEDRIEEKLTQIAPHLEQIKGLETDFSAMDKALTRKALEAMMTLEDALQVLMDAAQNARTETLAEMRAVKQHGKSATAYVKATHSAPAPGGKV